MKREQYLSWDTYFMSVALLSSFRSKDPKKQNGACIVDPNKKIIGIGYNGLPKGCNDDNPESWGGVDDDTQQVNPRHAYNIHAEKNAILNSISSNLEGAAIYVTQFPCNLCAQMIAQVGIKRVVYLLKKEHHKQVNTFSENIFKNAKIECVSFDSLNAKDKKFIETLQNSWN